MGGFVLYCLLKYRFPSVKASDFTHKNIKIFVDRWCKVVDLGVKYIQSGGII